MLKALAGEPWCLLPEQVARLTDYQVSLLFGKEPAAPAPEGDEAVRPAPPPPKAKYVAETLAAFAGLGLSREAAGAQYEAYVLPEYRRRLAEWRAAREG